MLFIFSQLENCPVAATLEIESEQNEDILVSYTTAGKCELLVLMPIFAIIFTTYLPENQI